MRLEQLWHRLSGAPEREAHERMLQAAQLGLINLALVNLNKALVAQARKGDRLQEDVLAGIKADCIARFHNYGALGLDIKDEAFVLNSALELLKTQLSKI
jgi:hypothetical protein